jgi:hypothetical protein
MAKMKRSEEVSRAHSSPSGGQMINDHTFWAGSAPKGSVFPEGTRVREYESANSAGNLDRYEQTSEDIHRIQEEAERKAKKHNRKDDYRN